MIILLFFFFCLNSSKSPYDGEIVSIHVFTYSKFYEIKWVAYTLMKPIEDPILGAKKMEDNKNRSRRTRHEYQVSGKYNLENEIDLNENIIDIWKEFKFKTPIPIKKDHFFALGSADNVSSTQFSYFFPNENDEKNSQHNYFTKSIDNNSIVSLSDDRAQVCMYYTLVIGYKNWSEKTHLNYPLSFQKIVPVLLFYFKKKMKIPRVLIYMILRMF
jgi:hypothetical protein